MAAGFLSSASALFKQGISANYTPSTSEPSVNIGLWKVHSAAANNTSAKRVSLWEYTKGSSLPGNARGRPSQAADRVLEVLKKEAATLSRYRHPSVLEVVEPLDARSSTLVFATEPVQCSLADVVGSTTAARRLELDEVELQKGLLQIIKGLQFLHEANVVHSDLTLDAIVVTAKGDWKLSHLAFVQGRTSASGSPTPWQFPEYDASLPLYCQRNLDYMAPEYAVSEQSPAPSNDMWSLGCIAYALLGKSGEPPMSTRGRLESYRHQLQDFGVQKANWSRFGSEVADLLCVLLETNPHSRPTAATLPTTCSFFSSILVSTLRFLDRDNYTTKSNPELISFMKGLRSVLPSFSKRVQQKRILSALLEQGLGKGSRLEVIPSVLPNVFFISAEMSNSEFQQVVLPSLKQLFVLSPTDSPECAMALLDHLPLLEQKTSITVFRQEITPLLLSLLSATQPPLLMKTLEAIPPLCTSAGDRSASLDFALVKDTIFPRVAEVFAKTTVLGVKVGGLICMGGLVQILDRYTITDKLVPILAKIKTKEPAVLLSALSIFQIISSKLTDNVVISTLILPQLWTMSAAPLLSEQQFERFMMLIETLSKKVRTERGAELKMASRDAPQQPAAASWEDLVRGQGTASASHSLQVNGSAGLQPLTPDQTGSQWNPSSSFSWDTSPTIPQQPLPNRPPTTTDTNGVRAFGGARNQLGARTIQSSSFPSASFSNPISPPPQPSRTSLSAATAAPMTNSLSASSSSYQPNYNLSFQPDPPTSTSNSFANSTSWNSSPMQPSSSFNAAPLRPSTTSWPVSQPTSTPPLPPGFSSGMLSPSKAPAKQQAFPDWKDLDPLL